MTNYELSPKQVEVIDALSAGASMSAAAEQAGIHRNTLANWRRSVLPFQQALAHAQYDRAMLFREKTEELAGLAINSIRDLLADPKTASSVRLRAALAIMQTACTPPEPPPENRKQLDVEKVVVYGGAAQHFVDETIEPSEAASPTPENLHKSAQQPLQTIRGDAPKVGRNDLCPCGSGQKFKRCCLNKPRAASFVGSTAA